MRLILFLVILVVGIVPGIIMRHSVIGSYQRRAVTVRTADVQNQCAILASQIAAGSYLDDQDSAVIDAQVFQLADIYAGRVLVIDDSWHIVRDTFGLDEGKTIISREAFAALRGESDTSYNQEEGYIEVAVPIMGAEEPVGAVISTVSTASIEDSIEVLRENSKIVVLVISAAVTILALFFTLIFERPVRRVQLAIRDMAEGYETEIPDIRTFSELKSILRSYNQSVARMRIQDESRNEFVSNVSHELKTPIASMKVLADSLLTQEDVPVEIYREFMQDIAREIDREGNIIADLLTLVRLENRDAMELSSVNINDLMEYILKRLLPIAHQRGIEMVLESFRPVIAEVDETKFSAAMTNLVENAVKYNKDGGYVHVSVNADHQYCYIRVEDSGIGIPEEDQENVFERFYRVDKSHSKEVSGTGLGLAIARNVIRMHHGTIRLYSNEGEGTTINVRIPLTYVRSQVEQEANPVTEIAHE